MIAYNTICITLTFNQNFSIIFVCDAYLFQLTKKAKYSLLWNHKACKLFVSGLRWAHYFNYNEKRTHKIVTLQLIREILVMLTFLKSINNKQEYDVHVISAFLIILYPLNRFTLIWIYSLASRHFPLCLFKYEIFEDLLV